MDSSTTLTSLLTADTIEYPLQDGSLPYMDNGHPHPSRLSIENLHTSTSMPATIPVPLYPPTTVSSDPLHDEPTSYAPPTLTKRTGHSLHNLHT